MAPILHFTTNTVTYTKQPKVCGRPCLGLLLIVQNERESEILLPFQGSLKDTTYNANLVDSILISMFLPSLSQFSLMGLTFRCPHYFCHKANVFPDPSLESIKMLMRMMQIRPQQTCQTQYAPAKKEKRKKTNKTILALNFLQLCGLFLR